MTKPKPEPLFSHGADDDAMHILHTDDSLRDAHRLYCQECDALICWRCGADMPARLKRCPGCRQLAPQLV